MASDHAEVSADDALDDEKDDDDDDAEDDEDHDDTTEASSLFAVSACTCAPSPSRCLLLVPPIADADSPPNPLSAAPPFPALPSAPGFRLPSALAASAAASASTLCCWCAAQTFRSFFRSFSLPRRRTTRAPSKHFVRNLSFSSASSFGRFDS